MSLFLKFYGTLLKSLFQFKQSLVLRNSLILTKGGAARHRQSEVLMGEFSKNSTKHSW